MLLENKTDLITGAASGIGAPLGQSTSSLDIWGKKC